MQLSKAQTLAQAYNLFDPLRPLEGEWMQAFYVERPQSASIQPLIAELELDERSDDKTLFSGHRGSGKTTELNRLAQALAPTHIVVQMDMESLLNLGDVDYADLLVMIGLGVFRHAATVGLRLEKEKLENLRFWYTTHILEEDQRSALDSEVAATLNAGIASITARLRTDAPRRQTVRAQAQANLSDLLERLNDLLNELQQKAEKRILVIVDGLDKMYNLDQVRNLFLHGANALVEPRCRILYTVPIPLYYTNDFQQVRLSYHRSFSLPNIKVWERDGRPCTEGRETLKKLVLRRMAEELITGEALEQLVDYSGGLLKELVSLTRASVLRAHLLRGERGPVQQDDVEYAARQVRNAYRALLTEEGYQELQRILQGGRFANTPLARDLLHNLSLLEYNGDGIWWTVHPIVRPLVEEWVRERSG
mgnify:FL=1